MSNQFSQASSFAAVLLVATASGCGPDRLAADGETGAATESDSGSDSGSESESDSATETGETEGGEPCFVHLETGHEPIWEDRFAWGQLVLVNRRLGALIVGDGDEWQILEPRGLGAYNFWGTAADAVFVESNGQIHLWDGQSFAPVGSGSEAVASVTESGEVWVGAHDCNNCPGRVARWDGGAFVDIEAPPLTEELRGIVARDDDSRWIVDDGFNVASQVGDAAWVVDGPVPNLEPTYHVFGFYPHGSDGLWLGARDDVVRLNHRDAQGVWTSVDYDPLYSVYNVSLAAVGDHLYLFDDVDQGLRRWDGVGSLELVASLPRVSVIFGTPERLLGVDLSHGQAIVEIDPSPAPTSTILWEALGVVPSVTRSAASLDAVYELDRRSLRRWSEGWTYLVDSDVSADPNSGLFGLWAESAEVAWISEVDDGGSPRTRLYRWDGEALAAVAHDIATDVGIQALWGSSGERLFAWGLDTQDDASVWAFDGQSWTQLPDPSPGYRPSRMTGSDDELFVVDELGVVFSWDGQAWSALPPAPANDLVSHDLEWAAGMLFYRVRSANAEFFYDENRMLVLDGAAWVTLEDRWPGGPINDLRSLSSDRAGRLWALDPTYQAQQLWYFDGDGWTSVPLEAPVEALTDGYITGAPEGMIIHGDYYTQQYRWECD